MSKTNAMKRNKKEIFKDFEIGCTRTSAGDYMVSFVNNLCAYQILNSNDKNEACEIFLLFGSRAREKSANQG